VNFTSYGRQLLIATTFGQLLQTPQVLYLALLYTTPNDTDSGSSLDEPAKADGYSRLAIPNDYTSFEVDGLGAIVLKEDLFFEEAAADWGRIIGFALCDDSVAGSVIAYSDIVNRFNVMTGDQVVLPEGALQFLVNPGEV
jgi:hypothetical protein